MIGPGPRVGPTFCPANLTSSEVVSTKTHAALFGGARWARSFEDLIKSALQKGAEYSVSSGEAHCCGGLNRGGLKRNP